MCVCNTELVCKAVRLAFSCQTSAISLPFIPIPCVCKIVEYALLASISYYEALSPFPLLLIVTYPDHFLLSSVIKYRIIIEPIRISKCFKISLNFTWRGRAGGWDSPSSKDFANYKDKALEIYLTIVYVIGYFGCNWESNDRP